MATYPQQTLGTTLLATTSGTEDRRVYLCKRVGYVEVGELTLGTLTRDLYDAPAHLHCIHLDDEDVPRDLSSFFSSNDLYLVDLMDALDERGVPYGYLSNEGGRHITYRPARSRVVARR